MKWANIQLHMVSIHTLLSAPLGAHMNYLTFSSNWSCKQNVSQFSLKKTKDCWVARSLGKNVRVVQVWGPDFRFLRTHVRFDTPVQVCNPSTQKWDVEVREFEANSPSILNTGQQTSRAHISRWKAVTDIQSDALMPTYMLWHTRTHTHIDIYMHTHGG